jgi:hypothetical protein
MPPRHWSIITTRQFAGWAPFSPTVVLVNTIDRPGTLVGLLAQAVAVSIVGFTLTAAVSDGRQPIAHSIPTAATCLTDAIATLFKHSRHGNGVRTQGRKIARGAASGGDCGMKLRVTDRAQKGSFR